MKTRKFTLLSITIACACTLALAQMRTVTTYVTGTGAATESDRSQALDEATQNAQNNANSSCIGTVTNTETIYSGCSPYGSTDENSQQFLCNVTVKATCEIQYRSKN